MIALLIVALLCPQAPQVEGLEVFELTEGCSMPLQRGWVITPDAFSRNTARIKGLDAKLKARELRLTICRKDRDLLREDLISAAKRNKHLIERLSEAFAEEPPSRVTWAGIGAGVALLSVVAGAYLYAEVGSK